MRPFTFIFVSLLEVAIIRFGAVNAAGSQSKGRSLSLLFENDGNFTNFANKPSALLFYDALTATDAQTACKAVNERLLPSQEFSAFSNQLSYLAYNGDLRRDAKFWVQGTSRNVVAVSPFTNTTITNTPQIAQFGYLCTNSAPHTSQVDTDFSSSPRTNVTSQGVVFVGTRDHLTFRFMGIPYAQPPIGKLRFQYTAKLSNTAKIVDGTRFKPACPQTGNFTTPVWNPQGFLFPSSLYLNIYTPFIPSNPSNTSVKPRPVIFWIHGGTNYRGTGSDRTFDGGSLVSRGDVVVVTINYRLGMLGFLALNDGVVKGNYALADKISALQWTKDNIAAFGGDPRNITIMGHSAGGWSIVDLLRSPKAAGLFQGALSQSGGASTFLTQKQAEAQFAPSISPFCSGTGKKRLQCLQSLSVQTIQNITDQLFWESVQDGVFIVNQTVPQVSQGPGAVNDVPFLTGFMPDEYQSLLGDAISPNATDFNASLTTAVGSDVAQAVLKSGLWVINDKFTVYNATINVHSDTTLTCPAVSMIHAAARSNAFPSLYVYVMQRAYGEFQFNPFNLCTFPVGQPQPYYRCHAGDLYEVFGTYYFFNQPPREDNDFYYTALVQDLWTSFARTHDPNPSLALLKARGPAYGSTLNLLQQTGWVWPKFENGNQVLASLEYPQLGIQQGLPDDENGSKLLR
ncbi:hypothetical protein D9758_005066 [Tetrapyrgos nigripes]|uniref:Carboxylic ester hydrolase n=1 Tax=Tetrapyrgos nigripes TaxID=182062 RepID=A0A8H5GWG2_9AGAR|nr:hypothetical protein D9758_005066 [Tetrapyrgos nigripes]